MKINGLPVVDGKRKIKIKVSEADVKRGNVKDPATCAAAKALLRRVRGCSQVRVHIARTYLKVGNTWLRFHTPQSLRSEIVAFDRGAPFQPGEYVLTPMRPSHRSSGKRQGSKPVKRRGKPRPYHRTIGVREWGANK